MSAYPPPQENVPIFDSALFTTNDSQLTISQLKLSFLQFPKAQTATETIPNLAISSSGTAPTAGAASNDTTIATTEWVNLYGGGTATNIAGGLTNQIPYQTAPSTTGFIGVGTSGYVLTAGVAGLPAWAPASGGGGATSVLYNSSQTITFATAGKREFMVVGSGGAANTTGGSGGGGNSVAFSLYCVAGSSITIVCAVGSATTITWTTPSIAGLSGGQYLIATAPKGGDATGSVGGAAGTPAASVSSLWGSSSQICGGAAGTTGSGGLATGVNLMWAGTQYGRGASIAGGVSQGGGAVLITTYA